MGYQEQVFEAAERLGGDVDKQLKPARDYLSRADALNAALEKARVGEEREYAKLVESAVSTGKLPALNGWGRWVYDSPSSKLVVAAVSVCHTKASAAARDAGPKLFAALQARVASVIDESVRLDRSLPPEVVDERTAMRSGRGSADLFTSWVRLSELVAVWEAAHELNRVMQRAGWVDGPSHPKDLLQARVYQAYTKPWLLVARTPPERHLAAAVTAGAVPGLFPWGDSVARFERLDRRQRDYRSMQVVSTHDSFGNVVSEQRSPEMAGEFEPMAG